MSEPPLMLMATAVVPEVVPPAAAITRCTHPLSVAIAVAATGVVPIEVVFVAKTASLRGRGLMSGIEASKEKGLPKEA
jgi:hypothetical protein